MARLRAWVTVSPELKSSWDLLVEDAAWAVNVRYQPTFRYSPVQILLGSNLRRPLESYESIGDKVLSEMLNRIPLGATIAHPDAWEYVVHLAQVVEVSRHALESLDQK